MSRRRFRPRLLCALAVLLLAACDKPAGDANGEWPAPSPALWEVRRDGRVAGWLFGTIHALPDGARWRTPLFDKVLRDADLLVVEIADLENASAAAAAFERLSGTGGLPPLLRRVPSGSRAEVRTLLTQARMEESDFDDIETWAAALILSNALRRHDPANGTDRELLREAETVRGLESFAGQFGAFDRLAEADQVELLVALAEEAEADRSDASVRQWLTGDLEALEREASEGLLADPELREALQASRNRQWVGPIASAMEAGKRPFVAVGAAHMVGAESLPALLEARGYAVRRLQ